MILKELIRQLQLIAEKGFADTEMLACMISTKFGYIMDDNEHKKLEVVELMDNIN